MGDKRIGVARASIIARLPEPLTTLQNDETLVEQLKELLQEHQANLLIIGLPRGLRGQTTKQTEKIRDAAKHLQQQLNVTIHWQDETLSSVEAEQELRARGVRYNKGAVDSLAATLILGDFLREHPDATL